LNKGKAVFVTEWGTCEPSGNGRLDLGNTQTWLDFLAENYVSDANWAINDKSESCSALSPGAPHSGGWASGHLTQSGSWLRDSLRRFAENSGGVGPSPNPSPNPGTCASSTEDCSASKCCRDAGKTCFEKDQYWASCLDTCAPGIHAEDPPQYQTPWSCRQLGTVGPTDDLVSKTSSRSSWSMLMVAATGGIVFLLH